MSKLSLCPFVPAVVMILNNLLDGEELRMVRSVVLPFRTHVNLSKDSVTAFFLPHVSARRDLSLSCNNKLSVTRPPSPLPATLPPPPPPPTLLFVLLGMSRPIDLIRPINRLPVLLFDETLMESEGGGLAVRVPVSASKYGTFNADDDD